MRFAVFFEEEKDFPCIEQIGKSSLGGATISARMVEKNFKI